MVRRGRIYKADKPLSQKWRVPAINSTELTQVDRDLNTYLADRLTSWNPSQQLFAAIGRNKSYSMWRIVSIDRMYSNEDLVTMRPLYFLGSLPGLLPSKIPEKWRTKVIENVHKIVDSMYIANADQIINSCRDVASASLCARFDPDIPRLDKTDLRPLANKAEEKELRIVASSARILADLHSRTKPNIQMHYDCRLVSERDAELAIQCFSLILRDLGYTRSS